MLINRRQALIGSVGAAAGLAIYPAFGQVPPLKKKDSYKVGFAQTESNNPWRLAQTASMKDEAVKRGCRIAFVDTMDFLAPGFFQKLGYQNVGEVADWDSQGHARLLFTKHLRPQ